MIRRRICVQTGVKEGAIKKRHMDYNVGCIFPAGLSF